jgi:hypoxanthine phosphoribosyltransferase
VHSRIDRILIDRDDIADRVDQLAEAIMADLASQADKGHLVVIPIMTGSLLFVADLVRRLPIPFPIRPVGVSAYPGASTTSTSASLLGPVPEDLQDKTVLLVDDILDSGRTLDLLQRELKQAGAAQVRTCVLLRKETQRVVEPACDYIGFDVPDVFVVGYGLDYDGLYRNLPDIGVLRVE